MSCCRGESFSWSALRWRVVGQHRGCATSLPGMPLMQTFLAPRWALMHAVALLYLFMAFHVARLTPFCLYKKNP